MATLDINGQDQQFEVPDDMPLLWVLRDVAGMTGNRTISAANRRPLKD
jgi:isoquinoline 1-oxidoreductase subunit alpha